MKTWQPPSFEAATGQAQGLSGLHALPSSPLNGLPTSREAEPLGASQHQQAFLKGLQQGLEQGRSQGQALGRQEGWNEGHRLGYEAGMSQGLQDAQADVQRLSGSLQGLIDALQSFPAIWAEELGELVFLVASRISGGSQPERGEVLRAVLESLQAVPKPGQTLTLRVSPGDMSTWVASLGDMEGPSRMAAVADPDLAPGQALLDLGSSRVDVGDAARQALLKSALGLLSRQQGSH